MKRTFLMFFILIVATVGVIADEDVVRRVAKSLEMTKDEMHICINNTSLTECELLFAKDLMKYDTNVVGDLQITDPNNTAFKIGCLFACLVKNRELMTGARMEVDKIREIIHSVPTGPEDREKLDQKLSSCASQVEGKTNECEVAYIFIKCTKYNEYE